MPGSFFGIDTAASALRNFQRAMEVTGNNMANVNTRGYSRQVVDFADMQGLEYYSGGKRFIGQGVTISSINQIRDQFLDGRMRDTLADGGKAGTLATGLQGVLQAMNEPGDSGISNALNGFFNAWSSFASNPNEAANKLQVKISAQTLTTRVRATYADLSNQATDTDAQIKGTISQIDQLSKTIAILNKQIKEANVGDGQANDLMDQRAKAIEDLSSLINVKQVTNSDGTVTLHSAQFTLVDSTIANSFPTNYNATAGTVSDSAGFTVDVRSGKLAGLLTTASKISGTKANLDALANTLRTQINTLHQTGTNKNGTTGINFFNDVTPPTPQTGAIDFNISAEVDADANNISSGVTGKAGDGGLALSIAQMRTTSIAGLGNKSITDFFSGTVTVLGSEHAYYAQAEQTQTLLGGQIDQQRQAVSGVSLDEEMQNMLKYQRSYQAAAKMISVSDEMLQEIIGMVR